MTAKARHQKTPAQAIQEASIAFASHNIGQAIAAHESSSLNTEQLRAAINDTLSQLEQHVSLPEIWGMPAREHLNLAIDTFENGVNSRRDMEAVIRIDIAAMAQAMAQTIH
jgi:hypothetical protein